MYIVLVCGKCRCRAYVHGFFEIHRITGCHFFSVRGIGHRKRFRPIFGRFRTRRIFCRPIFGSPTTEKRQKNRFFQNFLKIDLNEFRYRFRVQNNSKTPQDPISGHISSFWPISAAVSKIEILAKIAIFAIFTYF